MITVTSVLKYNPKIAEDARFMIIRALDKMSARAQRVARVAAPKDTGLLANSIHMIREYQEPQYLGGIRTNLPYAVVMEEGRRPGAALPPFDPIFRWVVRHRASFGINPAKPRSRPGKKMQDSRLRDIAEAVRWSIKRKGIAARKFFFAAERVLRAEFSREIGILGLGIKRAWEK